MELLPCFMLFQIHQVHQVCQVHLVHQLYQLLHFFNFFKSFKFIKFQFSIDLQCKQKTNSFFCRPISLSRIVSQTTLVRLVSRIARKKNGTSCLASLTSPGDFAACLMTWSIRKRRRHYASKPRN